jgi:hypothetical protein
MALLIEAMERNQFIRVEYVRPRGASWQDVADVMYEAGFEPCGNMAWTPGKGTYAWVCKWMAK